MTRLTLLANTLAATRAPLDDVIAGRAAEVLLTNVLYSDDAQTAALMAAKRVAYPAGSRFSTSMHEIARPVLNSAAPLVVVDNLNLYVSNMLLLGNSDPATVGDIERAVLADVRHLLDGLGSSGIGELVVITGEVDFDYFVKTESARLYRRILHLINGAVARRADRYGLVTNGTVLWAKGG